MLLRQKHSSCETLVSYMLFPCSQVLESQILPDILFLTSQEYKMHVYLLVNVLLLGITVALWCQGKLPHSTPVSRR